MKLIRETTHVFTKLPETIDNSPFKIEQADWDKIIEFNNKNDFFLYYVQRPIDYTWGLSQINNWYKDSNKKVSILDIGSGKSMWPSYIKKNIPNSYIEIVDIEEKWRNKDNELIPSFFKKLPKDLQVDKIDLSGYNPRRIPPKSFDIVCTMSAVEHFDNPIGLLRGTPPIIKKGGIFVMTTDIMDLSTTRSNFLNVPLLAESLDLSKEDKEWLLTYINNKNFEKETRLFLFVAFMNE